MLQYTGRWTRTVLGNIRPDDANAIQKLNPEENLTASFPPTLLIHGTKDTDVPYALSVQMDKELTAKGVAHEFITIPEGIHGFRSKADAEIAARTYKQVVEFLDKQCSKK